MEAPTILLHTNYKHLETEFKTIKLQTPTTKHMQRSQTRAPNMKEVKIRLRVWGYLSNKCTSIINTSRIY